MAKIMLVCNAGLSSGMLAKRIEQESNGKYAVNAYSEAEYLMHTEGVQLILVGPQLRFALPQIKDSTTIRVEPIDPMKYGVMDAKGIIPDIENLLKEEGES